MKKDMHFRNLKDREHDKKAMALKRKLYFWNTLNKVAIISTFLSGVAAGSLDYWGYDWLYKVCVLCLALSFLIGLRLERLNRIKP